MGEWLRFVYGFPGIGKGQSRCGSFERMERETGIEPATTGLGSRCSTIELLPPLAFAKQY
jgi:hypothetical protein